ncbi:transposase [Mycolicibacterium aubagnense]|uniref:transposase n=1 Tax=Mycolicibacterium aubagnense TaxID=319707 RepID=UPI003B8A6BF9
MAPKCPRCGSTGMYPLSSTNPRPAASGGRRWECVDCGKNIFRSGPDPDPPPSVGK